MIATRSLSISSSKLDKYDRLATYANRCGVQQLLDCLPMRGRLLVLNYHRIGDPSTSAYDPGVFSATEEELDQQIRFLKRHTRIVSLEDVFAIAEHKCVPRETWTLLTFDDGYRDNYRCAFPILRAHNVQGVFFLCTSFIGSRTLPWWDSIAYMVRNCGRQKLLLRYPHPVEFDCRDDCLRGAIRQILTIYRMPQVDPALFMHSLEEACGVAPPHEDSDRCFVNWEEVAEMASSGMALGAHSARHEILSKLRPEEQLREVIECRQSIERRIGSPVEAFAYPVGTKTSFTEDTISALRKAGYRTAFSFYGGVNMPSRLNAFDIQRCGIGRQIPARFECQIRMTKVAARFWP